MKISSYGVLANPQLGDKLIGTDINDMNVTKNFLIGDILELGTTYYVGNFVTYTGAVDNVNLGSHSITSNEFIKLGGTSSQFLKADGSVDSTTYATASSVTALTPYYGSFYDTTTQTASVINTAYPVKLNSNDSTSTSGFSIINDGSGNPTIIKAAHTGVYNIAFSAQLQRSTGGSSETIDIWLKKNGTNVTYSNTSVNVQANAGYLVAAWNFFVQMNANDEVQLMWATTSTAIQIVTAAASGIHPATPSVILTVNKVS